MDVSSANVKPHCNSLFFSSVFSVVSVVKF